MMGFISIIQLVAQILLIITLIFIIVFSFLDKRKKRKEISDPLVSFIVPCYNNGNSIAETIESIYSVSNGNVDLIVINDKSTDNTSEVLEKLKKIYNFTLINNKENIGKSRSLNRYSELAKHDILIFVDADVVINKRSFNDALARLNNKKVGAVSCPCIPKDKGFFSLLQHIEYNMISLVQGSYNISSAISLWGCFIAIKKKAFIEAGKFSLNAITEDMDLASKLNEKGWVVKQSFYPVKTYVPDTFKKWFKQKIRWSSGSIQTFMMHYRVWLKNPITIFFMASYSIFIISTIIAIGQSFTLLENVIKYFSFVNETINLIGSLKLTGLLYGAYIFKDIMWFIAFTFFSLPYVFPLIRRFKDVYLILLVIPFSIIYMPILSIVFVMGIIYFFFNYHKYNKEKRAW